MDQLLPSDHQSKLTSHPGQWSVIPLAMSLSRGPSQKSAKCLNRKGSGLSTLRRNSSKKDLFTTVGEGLSQHYNKSLKPFEEAHMFHALHSPPLEDADFTSRPSVLLVGQYSTGKTTFIRQDSGVQLVNYKLIMQVLARGRLYGVQDWTRAYHWQVNWKTYFWEAIFSDLQVSCDHGCW